MAKHASRIGTLILKLFWNILILLFFLHF